MLDRKIVLMEKKPTGGRFAYIDYLKGVSILTIVLFHAVWCYMPDTPGVLKTLVGPFSHMTRLFFFCSAFGLYYSHLCHPLAYPAFLKKRFWKVYVPYILVVAVCAFVPYTYYDTDRFAAFLSHVFLFKMFVPKYIQSFGPFWFMSSIFQYYLLFYVFVRMKEKIRNDRLYLLIWVLISLMWCALGWQIPEIEENLGSVYGTFVFMHAWIFVLGMLTAQILYKKGVVSVTWKQLIICLLVTLPVYLIAWKHTVFMNEIPRAVLLLGLVTGFWAVCGNIIRRFFAWLGSFSFEWYLTHMVLLEGLFRLTKPVGFARQAMVGTLGLLLTALAAWLYHQFVKRVLYRSSVIK